MSLFGFLLERPDEGVMRQARRELRERHEYRKNPSGYMKRKQYEERLIKLQEEEEKQRLIDEQEKAELKRYLDKQKRIKELTKKWGDGF